MAGARAKAMAGARAGARALGRGEGMALQAPICDLIDLDCQFARFIFVKVSVKVSPLRGESTQAVIQRADGLHASVWFESRWSLFFARRAIVALATRYSLLAHCPYSNFNVYFFSTNSNSKGGSSQYALA